MCYLRIIKFFLTKKRMNFIKRVWNVVNNSVFNNFSVKDKRQVLTLIVLLILIFVIDSLRGLFSYSPLPTDQSTQDKLAMLDSCINDIRAGDTLSRLDKYITMRYDTISLFAFDPNTVSKGELLQLGFTDKQAMGLLHYRENGGRFSTSEDLRRLYGMRPLQYRILKPYVVIANNAHTSDANRVQNNTSSVDSESASFVADNNTKPSYFYFDPNTITKDDIMKLGFSEKQASSFVNYRNKGKMFYVPRDFATVFFVDSKKYRELEPYIKIDLDKLLGGAEIWDINLANIDILRKAGLSDKEAEDVIDFRSKVGYFYSVWQLADCMPYKRVATLKDKFYVCASVECVRININTADVSIIASHPYFSDYQANEIVKSRNNRKFASLDELKAIGIFSDKELKKIENYVIF